MHIDAYELHSADLKKCILMIHKMHTDVNKMHTDVNKMHTDVNKMHTDVNKMHTDVNKMHTDVNKMHTDVNKMHTDVNKMHTDVNKLHTDVNKVHIDFSKKTFNDVSQNLIAEWCSTKFTWMCNKIHTTQVKQNACSYFSKYSFYNSNKKHISHYSNFKEKLYKSIYNIKRESPKS